MKIFAQTRFNPLSEFYDANDPTGTSTDTSSIRKAIMGILRPYVKVQEGKFVLYEYGKPYPDESAKWQFIIGMSAATLLVGAGALVFGIGRLTKKAR